MTLTLPPAPHGETRAGRHLVDPARWPDVARLPRASGLRTHAARRIIERAFHRLPLRVRIAGTGPTVPMQPSGRVGCPPTLTLRDPDSFYRRIGADGLIGFGESQLVECSQRPWMNTTGVR
ncbi:hypothetical protein ACWDA9_41360, partial [Streptomyces sp. NPDC001193]